MLRLRIRTKLLAVVIITTILVFGSFLFFNSNQVKKLSIQEAIELSNSYAMGHATACKNYMDITMGYTNAIANATQDFQEYTDLERDEHFGNMYIDMLSRNSNFLSVWNTIEYRFTDTSYMLDHGRKSTVALEVDGEYKVIFLEKDMDGHNEGSAYYRMKQEKLPAVMNPYVDKNVGDMLITSLTSPLIINGEYAGQGGIDMSLEVLQNFIDSLNLIPGAISMVTSNNQIILGHTNSNLVGDTVSVALNALNLTINFEDIVESGKQQGFEHEIQGHPYYTSIVPFTIDGTNTPWSFSVSLPIEHFLEAAKNKGKNIIWIGFGGILFICFIVYLFATQIVKPLSNTTDVFKELASGNINNNLKLNIKTGDELQDMSVSVNSLIDSLQKTEKFAREIEKGNLHVEHNSLGKNDRLGNALIQMRKGLLDANANDEARRMEDQRRNWALDGLAKFADILRTNSHNFEEYTRNLISNLVNYTESNQGAIYIVNKDDDNNKTINLMGSHAYEGDKLSNKVIEFGEGLVGVCIMEAKTTHLTELPDKYLSISSGLGDHTPGSLVITPLKHNDEVIGAIELASFKEYEKHQITFIKDVAQSIATTIDSLRIQQKSNELLEQTQQQAEAMMAQEEELRQNMEEMMATQEEMQRSESEMKEVIDKMKSKEDQLIKILDELEVQEEEIKTRINKIKEM